MARRQRPSGRKVSQRGGVAAKFGQARPARGATSLRGVRGVKQGVGGRRRPQPKEAAPARKRPTKLSRPQLRKRALRGADASKVRTAAPQQRASARKRPVSNRAPGRVPVKRGISSGSLNRPAPASNAGPANVKKKFQKGGEVEPLNDAHVRAFEANQAPSLAKAKSKSRSGRKTLGEASASARKRGTSKSKRLAEPLAIKESKELLPGESEAQMLIRTGRRKPKTKVKRR